MSLINQMLKDLETRRAEGGSAQHATLVRLRSGFLPWIVAGLLGIVAELLGVLLWQQSQPGQLDNTQAVAAQRESIDTTIAANESVADPIQGSPQVKSEQGKSAQNESTATETERVESSTPAAETTEAKAIEQELDVPAAVATPNPTSSKPVTREPVATRQDAEPDNDVSATEGSFSIAPSTADPREQAQRNIERGLDAARRGEHRRASEHLQAGLAILPREDEARLALHASLRRQGRIAEAEGVLEAGLVDAREPYRFAAVLARLRAQRGKLDEAVAFLKLDPPAVQTDPDYHALWGALLQQQGDYSAALPVYERLADYQPGNAQWLAGLGIARQQTGDEQGAIDAYERALGTGRLAETLSDYIQDQLNRLAPEEN